MKSTFLCILVLFVACSTQKKEAHEVDLYTLDHLIRSFHQGLSDLYNHKTKNIDSLFSNFFADSSWYITYWGTTEPIELTRERIAQAIPFVHSYSYQIEIVKIQSFTNNAYALVLLRQMYGLQNDTVDEYLPTTYIFQKQQDQWKAIHLHRSTDVQTFERTISRAKVTQ